jgi:protein arginine N-methyltransferase 1
MGSPYGIFDYHQSMLADARRVEAFERAISCTVKPGDVVLDLGTGTALLAVLACRAGARRVYAVEQGEVAELGRRVIHANQLSDRIEILNVRSDQAWLPERVNVVVGEIMGSLGLDEGILDAFIDARQRLLRVGGALVPRRIQVIMAPVELPEEYASKVEFWAAGLHGIDYSGLRGLAAQQVYVCKLNRDALRSNPQVVLEVDLARAETAFASGTAVFQIARECVIHGIGAWFRAELCDGLWIDNSPPSEMLSWNHRFFPLDRPSVQVVGNRCDLSVSTRNGTIWHWEVRVRPPREDRILAQHSGSTFAGLPLSDAIMRQQMSDHAPNLSLRGQVALQILQAFNGELKTSDLVSRVMHQAPKLFPSTEVARRFVRELMRQFGTDDGNRQAGGS